MQARLSHARHLATLILLCLFLTSYPVIANAATLNVPSQYATIGAAVTAASDGDTIQLAPGTYSAGGDLNLTITKSLTFEASGTAAETIIDCNQDDEFIEELDSNNLNLTFENLTIQNCEQTAFNLDDSSSSTFTFNGCVFTNIFGNEGIDTDESDTVNITGCTMDNNSADLLDIELGTITVSDSDFENDSNVVLYANSSTGTVSNCTFKNDGSSNGNGPITWLNASLTITDTTFTNNTSNGGGGAITIDSAGLNTPVTLNRCLFTGNSTGGYGGGAVLMFEGSQNIPFTATDCVFLNNSSSTDGAVIAATSPAGAAGSIAIMNCSFYGNSYTGGSASGQGVIAGDSETPLTITNTILYGDTTPNEISTNNPPSSTNIATSDTDQSSIPQINGTIDADPKYASAATGDLHLHNTSPCVQAGMATGAPATDFNQYTWGNTVSIGAYSPIGLIVSAPATTTPGALFSITVAAVAADDSTTVTNFSDTIHFTSSDASATLPADSTLTNGVGSFSVTLNTTGNQTITATDTSTTAITGTSADIVVASPAGPATHFVVTAPASVTSYTTNSLTVTAEDANGNVATGYAGMFHFTSSDAGSVLPADSTLTNGVGSFNFTLKTAGTQTITATDTANASITGTSNDITVVPGPAVRFILSAPATATQGTPFNFTVTAQDLFGNTATEYSGTVHFTSTDGLATLPADSTLTNGVGTFSSTLNTAGNQTITATDTTTPSITGTSGTIDMLTSAVLATFPAGLQMISAPSDYSAFSASQIFNPSDVDLAVWQPLSASYAITPTAPADTVRPGQGYWVSFTAPTKLLDIGQHVDETKPFSIPLTQGWNMIGDPFAENVPLSQIKVVVNGITQNFPIWPRPGAPVMSRLYTFPAGAAGYQVETVSLKPYMGYWLFASKDCTLIISPRPV